MPKKNRSFSRELKIETVKRMLRGENVCALTRELKVSRAVLYRWKDAYREEGSGAFRRKAGRPPKTAPGVAKARAEAAGELAAARQRVAELERKVGQQQVDSIFFGKPCGKSRQIAWRQADVAQKPLRRHRSDEALAARRSQHIENVFIGRAEPRRLLPPLACFSTARRGYGCARRHPACSVEEPLKTGDSTNVHPCVENKLCWSPSGSSEFRGQLIHHGNLGSSLAGGWGQAHIWRWCDRILSSRLVAVVNCKNIWKLD